MYCLEGSWLVRLLSLDLAILLDVDVIVGLEDTDFVFWEIDSETLDQGELVLDCAAICLGLVLGFVEFLGRGVFFQGDVEERHLECSEGVEMLAPA